MSKILFSMLLTLVLFSSCGVVKQNIDARANLAKCAYKFERVDLTDVKLGGQFVLEAVDFDVVFSMQNNSPTDVALDHLEGDILLDKKNKVLALAHKKFIRVKPKASVTEKIATEIPFAGIINQIGKRPEYLTVDANIWLTLLVGESNWEAPIPLPVSITVKIPWDQIDAKIEQKKQEAKDAADKAAKEKAAEEERKAKEKADAEKKKAEEDAANKANDAANSVKKLF